MVKKTWLVWSALAFAATLPAVGQSTATVTVRGVEQNINGAWDTGTLSISVNGYTLAFPNGQGQFSTPESMASGLAALMSQDPNSPVFGKAAGAVITVRSRSGGAMAVSGGSTASFVAGVVQYADNTSVAISSSTNPTTPGESVTFTASIFPEATGTITFLTTAMLSRR